jgi:hypothetical protein
MRHASEQNFTSFHTFSHFFRHVNGRPHTAHGFSGKSDFLRIFGMVQSLGSKVPKVQLSFAAPRRWP